MGNLELTIFGSIAAFFGWLQVDTYHDVALLRAIVRGNEAMVFRLVGKAAALRWFLMILVYGTFIPNTWRRCAASVGSLALLGRRCGRRQYRAGGRRPYAPPGRRGGRPSRLPPDWIGT
jgi:hypothetical protein